MLQTKGITFGKLNGAVYDYPEANDAADWKPNDPHEFVALEDNSRIVNIIKG